MSTATEQNFPIESKVIVNDPAHHLDKDALIATLKSERSEMESTPYYE